MNTLLELPRDEITQQQHGWSLEVLAGPGFAIGVAFAGRHDLYATDDLACMVRLFVGPVIITFIKLDRSKYTDANQPGGSIVGHRHGGDIAYVGCISCSWEFSGPAADFPSHEAFADLAAHRQEKHPA